MTDEAAPRGGVQSLDRALEILERLADAGEPITLSQLAATTAIPTPTIHRLLRTLGAQGYVRQDTSRRYSLGSRLIRLGEVAGRSLGAHSRDGLAELVAAFGETANMAVLDGDAAVYVAQVPSPYSMRTFTEVGRRVLPHCTGVGKAVLAQLADDTVRGIVGRTGMPARTAHTIVTVDALLAELARIRRDGYALDAEEQEDGVQCVAVAVPNLPTPTAISVSGPSGRLTTDRVSDIVPVLTAVAARLGAEQASA